MNKWEELLKKCGFKEVDHPFLHGMYWLYPDSKMRPDPPPATLDNIFKYVVRKVPVLDRPDILIRWVWTTYVLEVDGAPANDLIDILYESHFHQ